MRIHQGSILECEVDCIVSPANSFLMNGGGLARVIEDAAVAPDSMFTGHAAPRQKFLNDLRGAGLIPYGGAVMTSAGCLPFKAIIHAVGPIWGGGLYYEELLLKSAYDHALGLAEKAGFESIALPAIGAGVFGCPIDVVAKAASTMCQERSTRLEVTFALFEEAHVQAFVRELAR